MAAFAFVTRTTPAATPSDDLRLHTWFDHRTNQFMVEVVPVKPPQGEEPKSSEEPRR